MANHFSALKRARQTTKRTEVNRRHITRLRHQIRKLRQALQSGDQSAAQSAFAATVSVVDRSAQRGVIKKNTAARYKSRLARRLKALQSSKAA